MKKVIRLILIIFSIGGIIFSLKEIKNITDLEKQYDKVMAEVVEVNVSGQSDSIIMAYTCNEKKVEKKLDNFKEDMIVGDKFEVYCNPNNENNYFFPKTLNLIEFSILMIICILILGGQIISLLKIFNHQMATNFLIKKGVKRVGTLKDIIANQKVKINGKTSFIVRVEWVDPGDNKVYFYESEPIDEESKKLIDSLETKQIPVYLNPKNLNKYVVDVDFMKRS